MITRVVFAAAAAAAAAGPSPVLSVMMPEASSSPLPPRWQQDRFVISFWVDPIVPPARYDVEYARIKAANFSMLLGGFGANDRATVELQVAAATKHDIAAVPSFCKGACTNVSGAWGLQIADEPRVQAFSTLAKSVAAVKAAGKLAFVNLLPNYAASPGQTGAQSYEAYVSEFVATVKPNVLSTDHYPDFREPVVAQRKQAYIENMLILRRASLRVNIPWWNFFSAMPFNKASMYDISEAQLRWQIYTSLAIGAKGVLYFCYWTPDGGDFLRGQAIMTPDCSGVPAGQCDWSNQIPGQKYPIVQRLNAKLSVLGGFLLHRTSSAVLQLAGNRTHSALIPHHMQLKSINGTSTGPLFSFMLGFYDANATFLLSNQDEAHPALATVGLVAGLAPSALYEVNSETGAVAVVVDDAPFLPGLQISLLAGDARLFLFKLRGD